jgi:hypothetical protein
MDPSVLLCAQYMPPATEGVAKGTDARDDEGFHEADLWFSICNLRFIVPGF